MGDTRRNQNKGDRVLKALREEMDLKYVLPSSHGEGSIDLIFINLTNAKISNNVIITEFYIIVHSNRGINDTLWIGRGQKKANSWPSSLRN